ncbi:hypothetical protein ZWY2020_042116 [Hordeum vulgare]|nr:hypothetical protein ZWY2020_042116 [Hordeum vulgare]
MMAQPATTAAIVSAWSRMRKKPSTEGTRRSESVRKPHPDAALCCHRELDDDNELPLQPTSRKSSCCSTGSVRTHADSYWGWWLRQRRTREALPLSASWMSSGDAGLPCVAGRGCPSSSSASAHADPVRPPPRSSLPVPKDSIF